MVGALGALRPPHRLVTGIFVVALDRLELEFEYRDNLTLEQ
jgi:hypothetical protein